MGGKKRLLSLIRIIALLDGLTKLLKLHSHLESNSWKKTNKSISRKLFLLGNLIISLEIKKTNCS